MSTSHGTRLASGFVYGMRSSLLRPKALGDRLARRVGPVGYLARELLAEMPDILRGLR